MNVQNEERFYITTIFGSKSLEIISDVENLFENFIQKNNIVNVRAGNTIYFIYSGEIDDLNKVFSELCINSAYTIIDITDNLNIFDFRGFMKNEHLNSKEFMSIINRFLINSDFEEEEEEEVEEEISDEEKLKIAISTENYELAAKLRDKMNSVES